jgi:hypothetical protein
MSRESLLDFESESREKGYKPFQLTRENIKANIGKKICYVDFVEKHRGTYFVRYGRIYGVRYSNLLLNEGDRSVSISSIKECGIEIETEPKGE